MMSGDYLFNKASSFPRTLLCAGLCLLLTNGASAAPAWWSARGAVNASVRNDNAVVNEGQLKHFTVVAVQELNADYASSGGAGADLNNLVNGWQQNYAANNYASNSNPSHPYKPADFQVVNLGQLKHIAKLIYDRLQAVGTQDGYAVPTPAWLDVNPGDKSAAVIGQLKTVFNFDPTDLDGDGFADSWEIQYFGHLGVDPNGDDDGDGLTNLQEYQAGTSPEDYFNGITPVIAIVSGNGQNGYMADGTPAALAPLKIQVTNSASGAPYANAPVTFVSSGTSGVQLAVSGGAGASWESSLSERTDANGYALALVEMPAFMPPIDQSITVSTSTIAVNFIIHVPNGLDANGDGVPDATQFPSEVDPPYGSGEAAYLSARTPSLTVSPTGSSASISVQGQPTGGVFSTIVLGSTPSATYSVTFTFNSSWTGASAWIQPMDGDVLQTVDANGNATNVPAGALVPIKADGTLTCQFQTPSSAGLFQILVRLDGITTVLPLIAGETDAD